MVDTGLAVRATHSGVEAYISLPNRTLVVHESDTDLTHRKIEMSELPPTSLGNPSFGPFKTPIFSPNVQARPVYRWYLLKAYYLAVGISSPSNSPKPSLWAVLGAMSSPSSSVPEPSASLKPQRVLACILCQQRKVKCDRKVPCGNCVKASVQCVPASMLPHRPRKRRFAERELLDRVRYYEGLLRENKVQFTPLHPGREIERASPSETAVEDGSSMGNAEAESKSVETRTVKYPTA